MATGQNGRHEATRERRRDWPGWFALAVSTLTLIFTIYASAREPALSLYATQNLLVFGDNRFGDTIALSIRPEFVNASPDTVQDAVLTDQSLTLYSAEHTECFTFRAEATTRLLIQNNTLQTSTEGCGDQECIDLNGLSIHVSYGPYRRAIRGGDTLSIRQIYDRLAFDSTRSACGRGANNVALTRETFSSMFAERSATLEYLVQTLPNGQFRARCDVRFDAAHMAQLHAYGWANFPCTNPRVETEDIGFSERVSRFLRRIA